MLFFLNCCEMNISIWYKSCFPAYDSTPLMAARAALRLIIERIEIEHCAHKHYQREYYDYASYYSVDDTYTAVVELVAHGVDKPCKPEPPQQRPTDDAKIAHTHIKRLCRYDKSKLGERSHEKYHYERIGECNEESRDAITHERAFVVTADVYLFGRVRTIAVYSECHQHNATHNLQDKTVMLVVDKVNHKTHAEPRYHGVNKVADSSSHACHEAIPTPLVQRTLYAEHAHGSHRRRSYDAYKQTFEDKVEYI